MYKYDIFISYARVNDAAKWVTEFRNALKSVLMEKPEVQNVNIFMDVKDIEGGQAFDTQIETKLSQSAVLILILSEASLDPLRKWCQKERHDFIRHAGRTDSLDGRIYLVNYDEIEPQNLPKEINRFTPYRFFERDRSTSDIRPAALITERAGRFHKELYSLRKDLINAFLRLGAPAVRGNTVPDTVQRERITSDENLPVVFLAEAIPGQLEQDCYAQVESAIAQIARVVPSRRSYFQAWKGFEEEIDDFFDQADLFVQLLSAQKWPPWSYSERGYERWLFERAKLKRVPALRWQSRDLDISSVDEFHREFLQLSDDLFGCPKVFDLPDFIRFLFDALKEQQTRNKYPISDNHYRVLVVADNQDVNLGDIVGDELETFGPCEDTRNIEALLLTEGGKEVGDTAVALLPRGLVVVWDKGPQDRLLEFMRMCRRYRNTCTQDPPACAVVVPSLNSHPIKLRPPGFDVIAKNDQSSLQQLGKRICGEGL